MNTEIFRLSQENMYQAAERAGKILRSGGIVAFPTDTVYGLGARFQDAEAVRRIFEAKGRPENKPLSILVSGPEQAELLAETVPKEAKRIMARYWPGALTLIFRRSEKAAIPEEVTAGGSTIGIRMPDSRIARMVIERAGTPLAAPSANASGKRSAASAEEVWEDLQGKIPLILDGGKCPVGISSTILDVSGEVWKILREGSISREMLRQFAGRYEIA